MGNGDLFSIYIHHGGKFVNLGSTRLYAGGRFEGKHEFDPDKFGYLDIEDEIHKLGYETWNCIAYKVPKTVAFMNLCNDKDVMQMLQHLSNKCKCFSVYVDDGKKKGEHDRKSELSHLKEEVIAQASKLKEAKPVTHANLEVIQGVIDSSSDDDDDDWIPPEDNDEEQYETDDSLDDSELGSDDDEYKEARQNIRQSEASIDVFDNSDISSSEIQLFQDTAGASQIDVIEEGNEEEFISEYEDSEGEINSDSTDDELDFVRKKEPKIRYDPKCNHKYLKVQTGLRFCDGFECKEALRSWAILRGHPIHFSRGSRYQLEATCTPPCPWRCYGSMRSGESTFRIKVLTGEHSCTFDISNKLANCKWIAKQYINVFRVRPQMNVVELEEDVAAKYQLDLSRGRLYRAKAHALELLRGWSMKHHYNTLRSYIGELTRVDKEGRFDLLLGDNSVFKALYIGFSALRKGFMEGCRWIIGLDGCFLKTHLGGQLLCAIAKDGNNQMCPIAWAVVEVENQACWSWFLKILLEELRITDGLGVSFISDQQKGLANAVRDLAPLAEHRNCARHVYINWKKQFKGQTLKNMFWRAVRSTYQEEWDLALEDIKAENIAAYNNFLERDPQRFCKAFVSNDCFSDMVDNNISETFNGYIVKARGKHIINMLEDIRCTSYIIQLLRK